MTTLKEVNEALKAEFGDLELVPFNGYYLFSGTVCEHWYETGLYGGWRLRDNSPRDYIDEAKTRIALAAKKR